MYTSTPSLVRAGALALGILVSAAGNLPAQVVIGPVQQKGFRGFMPAQQLPAAPAIAPLLNVYNPGTVSNNIGIFNGNVGNNAGNFGIPARQTGQFGQIGQGNLQPNLNPQFNTNSNLVPGAPGIWVLGGYIGTYGWPPNVTTQVGQIGQVGPVGQVGQFVQLNPIGQVGQFGQFGQFGQVGQIGQVGQFGQIGQLGQAGQIGVVGQMGLLNPTLVGQLGNQVGQFGQLGQVGQLGQLGVQPGQLGGQFGVGGKFGQFGQIGAGQFGTRYGL